MDTAGHSDCSLRRIVAILVALAVLAARAAGRSFPGRWLVLGISRQAEAVARGFIVEATQGEWPGFAESAALRHGPADEMLLTAHCHLLAAMLKTLLPTTGRFPSRSDTVRRAPRLLVAPAVSFFPGLCRAGRAYDTS